MPLPPPQRRGLGLASSLAAELRKICMLSPRCSPEAIIIQQCVHLGLHGITCFAACATCPLVRSDGTPVTVAFSTRGPSAWSIDCQQGACQHLVPAECSCQRAKQWAWTGRGHLQGHASGSFGVDSPRQTQHASGCKPTKSNSENSQSTVHAA